MSVCFIVPYFGKLPQCFPFWLKSCAYNQRFNWLIITDDKSEFDYPDNVKVVYKTLPGLEADFSKKLGFPVTIYSAYKLCDYRPLYGFLFQEELKCFSHWGYTDVDMILGNLEKFITPEMLDEYDKIQEWGHLSIYKNEQEVNEAFRSCDYKRILKCEASFIFDEPSRSLNINRILKQNGKKVLPEIKYADINSRFFSIKFMDSMLRKSGGKWREGLFEYQNGAVYAHYLQENAIQKEEFAYVHFQKRTIAACTPVVAQFLLIPDAIIPWRPVEENLLKQHQKRRPEYYLNKMLHKVVWRVKNEWLLRKGTRGK